MLQSIGMSEKQLYQMVQSEGILLAGGNVLLTLVGGTLGGIGMIEIMRHFEAEYMRLSFPTVVFSCVYGPACSDSDYCVESCILFLQKRGIGRRIRNSD